jgi:hypothetical protein
MDNDDNIGFQDPDQEDMPSEMKDHWLAAFGHLAGQNPHPGKYKGTTKRKGADRDDPTESELDNARQQEANATKMHAAQTGGGDMGLGPTGMDTARLKQQGALQQQAATQAATQAQQAQAAQSPVNAPPAPSGPVGSTIPFPAQKGAVGGGGNLPQPSQAPAPPAPDQPPDQGEDPNAQ